MSSNDIPSGGVVDNDYASRTGQSQVPVQKDETPVESTEYDNGGDSDKQLERDEKDAIDTSNIIDERTRGATKTSGTYREPGDEEGLGAAADGSDGTSATAFAVPIEMSGQQKLINNARIARHKAIHQKVYISGIKGYHTLETGVAYHYRGHFVYAYPACVPIEPVPYSTKKGINLVGVAQHLAPPYDPNAPDLVEEHTIYALQIACIHEAEYQKGQEELRKQETEKALEEETKLQEEVKTEDETVAVTTDTNEDDVTSTYKVTAPQHVSSAPLSRVSSKTTLSVLTPVTSCNANTGISLAALNSTSISLAALNKTPRMGSVEAPFSIYASSILAGARFTPRPIPSHGLLRPAASTTRLEQLLAEEGVRRSMSSLPFSGVSVEDMIDKLALQQGWMDPDDVAAFVETVSRRPSRPASRQQSRNQSPGATTDEEKDGLYLHGFDHSDVIGTTASRKQTPRGTPRTRSPFVSPSDSEHSNEFAAYLSGLENSHAQSSKAISEQKKPALKKSDTPQAGSQTKPSPLSQTMVNRDTHSPNHTDISSTSPFAFPSIPETSRRRAASKILNEAYNAANPSTSPRKPKLPSMVAAEKPDTKAPAPNSTLRCSVHYSEACDGTFVSQPHLTQRHREGSGFKDLVPTIDCVDGRKMVDWAMIRDQEMEKMRIERGEK
ncbi:hypothetical protein P3342_012764 [Pyrenophora teres f. teres]|nr:hypothetical protein P3342_012764 [Pyrenophora teres f. teres]